jgi:hypothetical protein
MLIVNVAIKTASASRLAGIVGVITMGRYLICDRLTGLYIALFWELLYRTAGRCSFGCEAEIVLPTQQNSSAL